MKLKEAQTSLTLSLMPEYANKIQIVFRYVSIPCQGEGVDRSPWVCRQSQEGLWAHHQPIFLIPSFLGTYTTCTSTCITTIMRQLE